MTNKVDYYANILWNYLQINQKIEPSDCILVFGGHDLNVAVRAAELFNEGWANLIVISGGVIYPPLFYGGNEPKREAEAMKETVVKYGISEQNILVEENAKNTSENFWFTDNLLQKFGHNFNKFIITVKPYTERRTYATALKRWQDKQIIVTSQKVNYEEYINGNIPKDKVINMMTGEIKRIKEYPDIGYSIYQEIPSEIWDAYTHLVQLGYTDRH